MCFVHKHMQNADFGQILCRRASTKRLATDGPIFANLVSKDVQDLKEKTHERACRDLRQSRGSRGFRTVKIGLREERRVIYKCSGNSI